MADGSVWELSRYSIESYNERFSTVGKILKSMWMLGPSKAVTSKGYVADAGDQVSADNSQEENTKHGEATAQGNKEASSDNASSDSKSEPSTDNKANASSESFSHSYSILEAFSNMHFVYEADPIDGNNEESKTGNKDNAESNKEPKDGDEEKEYELNDTFQSGKEYEFDVGIKEEGYTRWKVVIDARADTASVINAIRSKKFKAAYQIASKNVQSDGLVPLSCTTYINRSPSGRKDLQPPFIGHCRYAIDAGSEGEGRRSSDKEGLTLCLAVAPINGRTKKPDEDVVIQAVYNVTGDITGGVLGNLLATATSKIRNKALGTDSDRYYRDTKDKDSEESKSDQLSEWLHKKFRCVGDHTMYGNFLTLRNFIKKQIAANNLELEALFVGSGESGTPINAQVSTFFDKKKFATFF